METFFRVINRSDNKIKMWRNIPDLVNFLESVPLTSYIVIKSDAQGDRVVDFSQAQITSIELDLKDA